MKIILASFELSHLKTGVHKKIIGQGDALKSMGFDVYYLFIDEEGLKITNFNINYTEFIKKIKTKVGVVTSGYNLSKKIITKIAPDILYQRSSFHEPFFISYLKYIRKNRIRIFYEIPTFPYDNEFYKKKFPLNLFLLPDRFYRKNIYHLAEKVVTYTDHEKILGVKTIKLENGIVPKNFKKQNLNKSQRILNIIAVANISFWHGYDRMIKGLYNYYQNSKSNLPVFLKIIGGGPETERLISLVEKLKLQQYVSFTGRIDGKELDIHFDNMHIGVDVLGMFRRGFNESCSLKAREYCARGIPFISSSLDGDFDPSFKFRFKCEANEKPIVVDSIIKFYKCLNWNTEKQDDLISFANERLSWEKKMKRVTKYF